MPLRDLGRYDIFRKIPRDLTTGTVSGASLSFFGVFFLCILFIFELNSYISGSVVTDVVMDTSTDAFLRVNFNVTLPNIPCQYASVDVQDVLKTRKHNITVNVEKWVVDFETQKRLNQVAHKVAAPKYAEAPATKERHSEELLGTPDFEKFVKGHDVALVNFYAPWCIWCKRLHPVWEDTAGRISDRYMKKVQFAKVDCTNPQNLAVCKANHIVAFPTITVYRNHKDHSHEHYNGDRTVDALMGHVDKVWADQVKKGEVGAAKDALPGAPPAKPDEPKKEDGNGNAGPTKGTYAKKTGCMISGFVDLNKVPGSLFFTVESDGHSFDASSINMTHFVHHLSYGPMLTPEQIARVPSNTAQALSPLKGLSFQATELSASYEHYLKVVGSTFNFAGGRTVDTYTYTTNSHQYVEDGIASAKFTYDLSPMSIVVSETRPPFYKFITSVCAIIGGVFTVIGLLDSMVYHGLRSFERKVQLGKTN